MVRNDELEVRLSMIEGHVMSQDRTKPGLLMRVDRLDLFVKLLVWLAAIGVLWRGLDVVQSIFTAVLKP